MQCVEAQQSSLKEVKYYDVQVGDVIFIGGAWRLVAKILYHPVSAASTITTDDGFVAYKTQGTFAVSPSERRLP